MSYPSRALLNTHGAHAHTHTQRLAPNDAAGLLHRRLHLGLAKLKLLARSTLDAPKSLALATAVECEACPLANARSHPHPETGYTPSRVGSIIFCDDAGPHANPALGGALYFRVFVDAHSRYRLVYLLRSRHEGLRATQQFVAEFNSLAGAAEGNQIVSRLHTDNAREFDSHPFKALLAQHSILHTWSPPHIKAPNGIAERAIGVLRAIARSAMLAANAPIWTWGCAILHAEDVLNHASGPSDSQQCKADGVTSFQLLTGISPAVMQIITFGCYAIVKTPPSNQKITFGARGAAAINLGRSRETKGAYRLWLINAQKIYVTSDVSFDESKYPWRPHTAPPTPQPISINRSGVVLNLFSGPYNRKDGLSAHLRARGYTVIDADNCPTHGGGHAHDILNDQFYDKIETLATSGKLFAVFAAPPCSTFSCSRFFHFKGDGDSGPPPVRDRTHILGLPNVPERHAQELRNANLTVARCMAILNAVALNGGHFVLENPASRSDPTQVVTYDPALAEHGPLWLMPEVALLKATHSATLITFAQCMIGSKHQKYTSLLASPLAAAGLTPLTHLKCNHSKGQHDALVGKDGQGT